MSAATWTSTKPTIFTPTPLVRRRWRIPCGRACIRWCEPAMRRPETGCRPARSSRTTLRRSVAQVHFRFPPTHHEKDPVCPPLPLLRLAQFRRRRCLQVRRQMRRQGRQSVLLLLLQLLQWRQGRQGLRHRQGRLRRQSRREERRHVPRDARKEVARPQTDAPSERKPKPVHRPSAGASRRLALIAETSPTTSRFFTGGVIGFDPTHFLPEPSTSALLAGGVWILPGQRRSLRSRGPGAVCALRRKSQSVSVSPI